ncbi:MAG: TetR/AcrR family transcriptional regulator [Clostridia bacterium]|nr:TetR/AcrR family transcriptional regulator [Clostridia bacterium]
MEKTEKKSFLSRLLNFKGKTKSDGTRLYSNTKQTTTKIKLALLDLLNSKQLSQINITNLVKVAGVYRATFYLHYKSLNDVVLDIERDVIACYDNIKTQIEDIDIYNNMDMLIEKLGEYIQIDKKYLSIIINANCFSRITLKLRQLLNDIIVTNFKKFGHIENEKECLLDVSVFTGGVVFAYRDWINSLDIEFEILEDYIKNLSKQLFKKQ